MENTSFIQRLLSVFRSGPNPKAIAAQLRKPSGKTALEVAGRMNQSNEALYDFTLGQMDIANGQVIMEIGYGNGRFFEKIHAKGQNIQVYGLDHSPEMFAEAKKINRKKLDAGGLGLYLGSSESIPLASEIVDQVFCINVVYFWEAPSDHLREIHRVLKPGGRLYVAIRSRETLEKMPWTRHGFKSYTVEEWKKVLENNKFQFTRVSESVEPDFVLNGEPIPMRSYCIEAGKV